MADDDRRIEGRVGLVGRGSATTPERIAGLEQRARELEKLSRPKPAKSFAEVVGAGVAAPRVEPKRAKPRRERKLMDKAPRPGLSHPAQREVYGRGEDADEPIIIKG